MQRAVLGAIPLAVFLFMAMSLEVLGQDVLIYSNQFITPLTTPGGSGCQVDFSADPVNDLWAGTAQGTFSGTFQQTNTVETILVNGPGNAYSDPQGVAGDYCLGMLNTHFGDKLALLIDTEGLPFVNVAMDVSAINTNCGGPFSLGPVQFLLELIDAPAGVFDLMSITPLAFDTLFGTAPNAPTGAGSFTFNWARDTVALDASGSTDGLVALRFTLLNTGVAPTAPIYATFDNIHIEASLDEVITGMPEQVGSLGDAYPVPCMDRLFVPSALTMSSYAIWSMNGQRVAQGTIGPDGAVSVSALPPGVYLLHCGERVLRVMKE